MLGVYNVLPPCKPEFKLYLAAVSIAVQDISLCHLSPSSPVDKTLLYNICNMPVICATIKLAANDEIKN